MGEDQMIIKSGKKDYMLYLKSNLQQPPPIFALHKVSHRKSHSLLQKYTVY